jgi:hypothetical protein
MQYPDWFIYLYIKITTFFIDLYNRCIAHLFKVRKIYSIDNNVKTSIYHLYLLMKLVKLLEYYLPTKYSQYVTKYKTKYMGNKYKIVKLELKNTTCTRDILIEYENLDTIVNIANDTNFNINELFMNKKVIVTNIVLIHDNNRTDIKKLLEHYADRSGLYNAHTLNTILLLKNLKFNQDSQIEVTSISHEFGRQIVTHKIRGQHVNQLYA